jgi:biotin operon repressor
VRPTAEADIKRLDAEKLQAIAARLGPKCEVVADFSLSHHGRGLENKAEDVLSILKRRPCSLNDICSGLGIGPNEALKYVTGLQHKGIIHSEKKDGRIFFKVN